MENKDNMYFAAKPAEDCAAVLMGRAKSFYNTLESNNYLDKIRDMWKAYYGDYSNGLDSGHTVSFTGEQGELVQLPVNHFRNLAEHINTMVTAQRPAMEARAINTDYKSLAQTILANGILDYYMREKGLEDCLKRATEMAIVLGSGFIKLEWNALAGEEYDIDPDTGSMTYDGDAEFSTLSPLDVVVDGTKEAWNNEWILTRSGKNRYDITAKYPELAEKIKSVPTKEKEGRYNNAMFSNDETDDVYVYEFYHKRTESMPNGRYLAFLSADVVLIDTNIPYRTIPIFRIAPSTILGTPYGYTPMFDVFPLQEAVNSLYSALMTNNNAFAVQNLWIPRGSDIDIASVEGGMNVISSTAKPEPIQLTASSPETYNFLEKLIKDMETISGVNSVARGNPDASLKSGTALALVQSMAIQFISGLQQSYVKLIEDVGTGLINILKDFATTPRIVALVGKQNRTLLKEFTGEQIKSINRVVVDIGNPLARTTAGRVQMAEQLLQMQLLKTPEQYFQVINTGRLDVVFEGEQMELLNIKSENEQMMDGKPVEAFALDQHRLHILEHRSLLADPDLRQDPELRNLVLTHIMQHIQLLKETAPELLQLIGEQPLVPPQAAPPQPMPGGAIAPDGSLNGILQGQQPPMNPQDLLTGQGVAGGNMVPQVPSPPAPFQNLPTDPALLGQ